NASLKLGLVNSQKRLSKIRLGKAHAGIFGNEILNQIAKSATKNGDLHNIPAPKSHLNKILHKIAINKWQHEWTTSETGTPVFSIIPKVTTNPASWSREQISSSVLAAIMQTNFILGAIGSPSPFSLAIALATLFITLIYFIIKERSLPPGPAGLPYFGYWPFINDNDFHLKLDALKKQHGDVFSFNSTGRLYVNLGSIKAVREALISKSEFFGDRISDFSFFSFLFKDGKNPSFAFNY
ncbi:hypothetical protein AVEN_224287-1, partial [Araneus ventricosus]